VLPHKNIAVVLEDSVSDFAVIRERLVSHEIEQVLHAASPEDVGRTLDNGTAPGLVVVSVGSATGEGIDLIRVLKRRWPELQIIATGPAPIPELILGAVRAGAVEFLVRPVQPVELDQALDRVLRAVDPRAGRGESIAVYSAKGGLGTTTVAVNLAFAVARLDSRKRIALVDSVVHGGDVRVFLDVKPNHTIKDVAEDVVTQNGKSLDTLLHAYPGGVWVCTDPNLPDEGELLDRMSTAAVMRHLTDMFAYTVVDCEHNMTDRTLAILDHADKIAVLTHLTVPAVRSLQRTLDLFSRLKYPDEKVVLVVNRHGAKGDITLADFQKVIQREILATLPNDYHATVTAAAHGLPVHQAAPKSKFAKALDHLAAQLVGARGEANGRKSGRILRWKSSTRNGKKR
jgi:pilus assembly protein CpaE